MADFEIAYRRTLKFEGGEKMTDDPNDPGKKTKYGISQRWWPDYWKDANGDYLEPEEFVAVDFYNVEFWDKMRGDEIDDQLVANEIFDTAVNCGYSTWHFVQEAYNCLSEYERIKYSEGGVDELEIDGRIGPVTVKTINAFCTRGEWRDALLGALDHLQGRRYWDGKAKYRKGWFAKRIGGHHRI